MCVCVGVCLGVCVFLYFIIISKYHRLSGLHDVLSFLDLTCTFKWLALTISKTINSSGDHLKSSRVAEIDKNQNNNHQPPLLVTAK